MFALSTNRIVTVIFRHTVSVSLYPSLHLPPRCSLSVPNALLLLPSDTLFPFPSIQFYSFPLAVRSQYQLYCYCYLQTHCFSFPLSNSTVILSLFALSTNCTDTVTFRHTLSVSLYLILQLPSRCSLSVPTVLLLLHSDTLFQFPSIQFYSYPLAVRSQYQLNCYC
jgi:hypothetical protein